MIICKTDISEQLKKTATRYIKIYNMYILRYTACMLVNPIMVDNFASLYNCMSTVGPQTKWRHPPQSVSEGWLLGPVVQSQRRR